MSYTSAIANFSNDADGDQILNAQENNIGTDPRVVTSSVEVYNAMSNRLSLVQAQEVMQDLRVGSKTFTIVDGTASVNMNIDKSGNLIDWTNTSYTIEGDIPADENKLFLDLEWSRATFTLSKKTIDYFYNVVSSSSLLLLFLHHQELHPHHQFH